MKNVVKLFAGAALAAVAITGTSANAAEQSATATAKILKTITVSKNADLNFGTVTVGTTGDTVVVSSTSGRTCGGNLVCSGTVSAAGFTVAGSSGETVSVSSDATVQLKNGTNTMSASLTPSTTSMTLAGSAADAFTVGGTLTVGANQVSGTYSGTFKVNVNYN